MSTNNFIDIWNCMRTHWFFFTLYSIFSAVVAELIGNVIHAWVSMGFDDEG